MKLLRAVGVASWSIASYVTHDNRLALANAVNPKTLNEK